MTKNYTKQVRRMIKQSQDNAEKFYHSCVTRHLAFEVAYIDYPNQNEYFIEMMAQPNGEDKIIGTYLVHMSAKDFSYNDFVDVLKALFDKWHYPIYVVPSDPEYVSEKLLNRLKETFNDAVKSGEVYDF